MLCQRCKKNPAAVHMTKIINNMKTEIHLCGECAREREDVSWFSPFSINDLLASFLATTGSTVTADNRPIVKCDRCGMDFDKFKKKGRFGCENCYQVFKEEIYPIIRRVQGGAYGHTGKKPKRENKRLEANKEIEELKQRLEEAVRQEAFEEAAKLRDYIRELERKEGQEG